MCNRVEEISAAAASDMLGLELSAKAQAYSSSTGELNGFDLPYLFGVSTARPDLIGLYKWGLVPPWITPDKATDYGRMTLNARSEELLDKPSYKQAWRNGDRNVVAINAIVEYRHEGKEKVKHRVFNPNGQPILLGCVFSIWENTATTSILTTAPNAMFTYIHNSKLRMPVVILPKDLDVWLDRKVPYTDAIQLTQPFEYSHLQAESYNKKTGLWSPVNPEIYERTTNNPTDLFTPH